MTKVLVAVYFEAKQEGTVEGITAVLDCRETARTLREIEGERKCIGHKALLNKDELDIVHKPTYAMSHRYWVWGAMYEENDEHFTEKLTALTNKVMQAMSTEINERHKLSSSWVSAITGTSE